jgi:maltooligosyltrehalose trehalohydrolase
MKSKHEMPFGAEYRADGSTRFRLWAPEVESVRLALTGANEGELPMLATGSGWFELSVPSLRPRSRYKFKIGDGQCVPDPASRFQPEGVHGCSEVIYPAAYEWHDDHWRGRPWSEAIIYELHLGTFTSEGTYRAAESKLDYLSALGITAIEIMPVSSFPGRRNWGYDGVLPFAPASVYGRPQDFKHFVEAAHARNFMVLLDVVYNHFGPEGNYLPLYAPQFFTDRHKTPWGQAINFDGADSRSVRDFFIHNALYWLEEYHLDGLRLDAVHAIADDSNPDILNEIAEAIRCGPGAARQIHLVLENDNNAARYLERDNASAPKLYTAQWNDDMHHAAHVLVTHETDGYYSDYAERPAWRLGRCLAEGFSYQGESSKYRGGETRGEPSKGLRLDCFVNFLQNHDQVGNRATGERIVQFANPAALKVAVTCLLLAPSTPLLFMGEEFGASTPFLFFCDFGEDLAAKVTEGRRAEFARFVEFRSPERQKLIPDPNRESTFERSKLDWESLKNSQHTEWLDFYRELLSIRRKEIRPRIGSIATAKATHRDLGERGLSVRWPFLKSGALKCFLNFAETETCIPEKLNGRVLYTSNNADVLKTQVLPAYSAAWLLEEE